MKLGTSSGEVTIGVREIERVSISVNRWKVTGLLIGVAVDVVVVVLGAFAIEESVASSFGN